MECISSTLKTISTSTWSLLWGEEKERRCDLAIEGFKTQLIPIEKERKELIHGLYKLNEQFDKAVLDDKKHKAQSIWTETKRTEAHIENADKEIAIVEMYMNITSESKRSTMFKTLLVKNGMNLPDIEQNDSVDREFNEIDEKYRKMKDEISAQSLSIKPKQVDLSEFDRVYKSQREEVKPTVEVVQYKTMPVMNESLIQPTRSSKVPIRTHA